MKTFLVMLFAGVASVTEAEPSRKEPILASVHNQHFMISLRGQAAKDIFESMPKNSRVLPTKKCNLPPDRIIKVQGGFVCGFSPNDDLFYAYSCTLDASTKTGKALEFKKSDYCEEKEP